MPTTSPSSFDPGWHQRLSGSLNGKQVRQLAAEIGNNQQQFDALMHFWFHGPGRQAFNSAWVVQHCCNHHPDLFLPHADAVIAHFNKLAHHTTRRIAFRSLALVDVYQLEQSGTLVDMCFTMLYDPNQEASFHYHTINILWRLCSHEPELIPEFRLALERVQQYGTAGTQSRVKAVLKEMDQGKKGGLWRNLP
jgi:hypothetical protein